MSKILYKEAWFSIVSDEGKINRLLRDAVAGDAQALVALVQEYTRSGIEPTFGGPSYSEKYFPPFSNEVWASYYEPLLRLERTGDYPEWVQDWVWMAASLANVLPPIPRDEWGDISEPPFVEYTVTYEVFTEDSIAESDAADLGFITNRNDRYSLRQRDYPHGDQWMQDQFKHEMAADHFIDFLESDGYRVVEDQIIAEPTDSRMRYEDLAESVYWNAETGTSDLVSYREFVHIKNPQHREQVKKWLQE